MGDCLNNVFGRSQEDGERSLQLGELNSSDSLQDPSSVPPGSKVLVRVALRMAVRLSLVVVHARDWLVADVAVQI